MKSVSSRSNDLLPKKLDAVSLIIYFEKLLPSRHRKTVPSHPGVSAVGP